MFKGYHINVSLGQKTEVNDIITILTNMSKGGRKKLLLKFSNFKDKRGRYKKTGQEMKVHVPLNGYEIHNQVVSLVTNTGRYAECLYVTQSFFTRVAKEEKQGAGR